MLHSLTYFSVLSEDNRVANYEQINLLVQRYETPLCSPNPLYHGSVHTQDMHVSAAVAP